ncbi:MAG TPA: hypothetical protein VKQ72_17155 [Aggregatilineales bacterium]|nr:hypothetical protein [Aggregatilineales bacterium]
MPINLQMIENDWILHFQVEKTWTPEEILTAKADTRRLFEASQHPVHALVDLRDAAVNLALLQASSQVIGGDMLPNAGRVAVVGVSWLMRTLAAPLLVLAVGSDAPSFFDDIEEAKRYLRRYITATT